MPIICDNYDLLFANVPATGSEFVEHVLTGELGGRSVGAPHSTFRRLALASPPQVRVLVVMQPAAWYRSYWSAKQAMTKKKSAWPIGDPNDPTAELDRNCGDAELDRFVENALRYFPNGFVRSMYCAFTNGCTHALRATQLRTDLETLLRGVGFDRPSLARDHPMSATPTGQAAPSAESEREIDLIDSFQGLRFPYLPEVEDQLR